MDEVVTSKLSSLSRELTQSAKLCSPERHIKQALIAHGYFRHAHPANGKESSRSHSPTTPLQPYPVKKQSWEKLAGGITEEDKRKTTQLISQYKEGKEVYRLKEPRSLYAKLHPVPTGQTRKKLPLWPTEVECVPFTHRLLRTPPPHLEPFYSPPSEIISPKIRSNRKGCTIVYSNPRGPEKYFKSARVGPSRDAKSSGLRSPEDITLIFESRFESGNLAKAVQVGKWDYELYLSFDLYTKKHTQWYFFSVRNMRRGQTYRFTIVNLYKAGSLYNMGMQPVFYSTIDASNSGVGWTRRGHNIKYFKTPIRRLDTKSDAYYFGLTWSHTFDHEDDTCYFAHCYPYTYSDLQDDLQAIISNPVKSKFCKQRTLCQSLAGNPVPILTITSPVKSPEERDTKRAVIVTSRVHPGETNGSWMMKGLLEYLTGDSPDAVTLRDSFIFKVVPMLNPDGVIVGNYRCSLAGRDLNRNYRTGYQESYPVVWHLKNMIRTLSREREVVLFCDLHGHSRKHNVFIYGCDDLHDKVNRFKSRVFPKMLSKNIPSMFSYSSSKFGIHKSKEGTGRVVMWREMGITNSYTMEATFCGSLLGKMAHYQFRTLELQQMGYHLCDTLLDYCDPDQSKVRCMMLEIEEEYREAVLAHLALIGESLPPDVDPLDLTIPSMDSGSDIGSDSSESDGPPMNILAKERKKKKKKKLKSRRERNKQKAIIKMSHSVKLSGLHPPTSAAGPVQGLSCAPSATASFVQSSNNAPAQSYSEVTLSSGLGEGAKNGGIPMFIQERLDERQKKKSDCENAEKLAAEDLCNPNQMRQVEAIAREYLKQGFGAPLHLTDPRTPCNPLLQQRESTQGFLPITISSMSLVDNARASKQPSRTSSRAMLPQFKDTASAGGFASQYMANHLQRMTRNANLQDHSPPSTPPTNGDTADNYHNYNSNSNNNLNGDDNKNNEDGHNPNPVDFGDLSYLLNKIRPNLIGRDNRPQVNYRGQMYPAQQARPETRGHSSRVLPLAPSKGAQQHLQSNHRGASTSQEQPKVNNVLVHNFSGSPHSVAPFNITNTPGVRAKPNVADWAVQENAMARASRESRAWPLPVKQMSEPTDLFTNSRPSPPQLTRGSNTSLEHHTSSQTGAGQVMQVNSFSSNSSDLLARSRPQLPHTLAPITSSTDSIKQSIAEVLRLNTQVPLEEPIPVMSQLPPSILEHKRHVSKAVSDMHHKAQGGHSKEVGGKRSYSSSCQPVLSAVGPTEEANPALREHTRFPCEPHPLIVAKNERHRAVGSDSHKGLTKSRRHRVEQKENSHGGVGKVNKSKDMSASVNRRDPRHSDEDQEYYTELEDNVDGRRTGQILVRRRSTKQSNTSSGTKESRDDQRSDPLLSAEFQALSRPATNYRAQRPRPLRIKTKSAAPKKPGSISSSSRHSEIQF